MKFWWVVVVVVLLTAVQAWAEPSVVAVIAEGWGVSTHSVNKREDASVFGIVANEQDLNAVRGTMRLYIHPNVAIPKVRCGIIINNHKVSDISEHLIAGIHGPELWFSHIPEGELAEFAIYGKKFPPELYATTFEVTSNEGNRADIWPPVSSPQEKGATPFLGYQEVTLNDICEPFLPVETKS